MAGSRIGAWTRTVAPCAAVALAAAIAPARAQAPAAFAHVQTDKPAYRLGETVWFRVHRPAGAQPAAPGGLTLELEGPDGAVWATQAVGAAGDGSLFLDPARPGGACALVVREAGRALHRRELTVYDVRARQLDLSLRVLGEHHFPGDEVRAAVLVRDLAGRPLAGVRAGWRASFGAVVVTGETEPTDAEGGVVLRLSLPPGALDDGHLAVGVEHGKRLEAVARPVVVSASVGAVDFFPEGGAVVPGPAPGRAHRVGVLVRDLDGRPTAAEGRVVDEEGRVVDALEADARGCAVVVVPYEIDRRYFVEVVRPAGVGARFPLPGPTGHPYGLRLEATARDGLRAWVRAAEGARPAARLEVLRVRDGVVLDRAVVRGLKAGAEVAVDLPAEASYAVDEVVLAGGDVTWARAAVVRGRRWPLEVTVRPVGAPGLLRGEVALEVLARRDGRPAQADLALSVFRDPGAAFPPRSALAARALLAPLLAPALGGAPVPDALDDLFPVGGPANLDGAAGPGAAPDAPPSPEAARAAARREAFVLVHAAWAYPPGGLPAPAPEAGPAAGGPPAAALTAAATDDEVRVRARPLARRPRPVPPSDGSQAREGALARLLARAAFTRPDAPHAASPRRFGPLAAAGAGDPPGPGAPAAAPPQDARPRRGQADLRDCRLWERRVTTGPDGRAVVRLRWGDDLARFAIACEGFAGATGAGVAGATEPQAQFGATLVFPAHVRVGDRIDALVRLDVRDGLPAPLELALELPPCLRGLERTAVTFRPGRDAATVKFPLEVVAPTPGDTPARLRVVTRRGPLGDEVVHAFTAGHRELTLTHGRSGLGAGPQRLSLVVPRDAVPGSVEVRARVAPAPAPPAVDAADRPPGPPPTPASVLDDLESLLRTPTGCFEQTTSASWPNLVVLETLLDTGVDAHALERAWALAEEGHRRLLTFQAADGGFALYPGQAPAPRYTGLAVPQLAAYVRLFRGRGAAALERAVLALERAGASGWEAAHVTLALHEAGRTWSRQAEVLRLEPRTGYERALVARCLATWVGAWPAAAPREARLAPLVESLAQALGPDGLVASAGEGLMGSRGAQLALEATALAVPTLLAGGRADEAAAALVGLAAARSPWGGWGSTRSTALAIRAFAHAAALETDGLVLARVREARAQALPFRAGLVVNGARTDGLVGGRRDRSLVLARRLDAGPGARLDLALTADEGRRVDWGLGCTYRVAAPRTSPLAPFTLETALTPQTAVGAEVALRATIRRVVDAPLGAGQVVARIALPGGMRLADARDGDALAAARRAAGAARADLEDGAVVVYWANPEEVRSFDLALEPVVAGHFRSGPSVVYPYYETGREAYAAGHEVRIDAAYDLMGGAALQGGR